MRSPPKRDLIARGFHTGNATRIRGHITPALGARPVGLLTAREFGACVMACSPVA